MLHYLFLFTVTCFNPTQDDGSGLGQNKPPRSFSSVIFPNVGFRPQNVLAFSLNPFATLL